MLVYEFLESFNELSNVKVRIFDCTREDIVFDRENYKEEPVVDEVSCHGFDDYEVGGVDLYTERFDGRYGTYTKVVLEINIEMDEEEDDSDDE